MLRRCLIIFALTLAAGPAWAHSPAIANAERTLPTPATATETASYAAMLGAQPTLAATFGEDLALAVVPAGNGQQSLAAIALYIKFVLRMPMALPADRRISNLHLRGDLVAFRVEAPDGTYDYLWDTEELTAPYWKLTGARSGKVTYSPNLGEHLVAGFYLRDPHVAAKWIQADTLRKSRKLGDVLYIDSGVLIVGTADPAENAAFRWRGNRWVDAGSIKGVVNHHAVIDLNADGLIEVLASDTDVTEACTRTWSALYTWNAAKTQVVPTGIRTESANNLSGACAAARPACFRDEFLTWDRTAGKVTLKGVQDTTGCGGTPAAAKSTYQRRFAWDAKRSAFAPLPD